MKRRTAFALCVLFALCSAVSAKELTLAWNYSKHYFGIVKGFKVYSGTTADAVSTLVADVAKAEVVTTEKQPILLEEHFDTDPGDKYNVTRGSWEWVSETKNMHFTGPEFMVVFEYPAGTESNMSFVFWPEKSTGDAANLYSYIKDEAASTDGGVYYELRIGDAAGTRYSNWRKVYDKKYGGIDPNGAFALPRYNQCNIVEGQDNLCPGFAVYMDWDSVEYSANLRGPESVIPQWGSVHGMDADARALDINKLEIIINQQDGWLDDIVIGGLLEVRTKVNVTLPSSGPLYFVATAYNDNGESGPSAVGRYEEETGGPVPLQAPKNMTWRKLP